MSSGVQLEKYQVPVDKLRLECDTKLFNFTCTKDLVPLREFIGQDRAINAVEFGLNMGNSGFNIYVAGLTGTGKTSVVKAYIDRLIEEREKREENFVLNDWCYLYNFKDPDHPQIISLPQGKGKTFQGQITALLGRVKDELSRSFASEEYKKQRQRVVEEGQSEQQKVFEEIANEARQQGFALQMTPSGPVLVPMTGDRPMEQQEFLSLGEEPRKKLEAKQTELLKKLREGFERASRVQRQIEEKLQKDDRDIGNYIVSGLFAPLFQEYGDEAKAKEYLEGLQNYTVENLALFKTSEEPINPIFGVPMSQVVGGRDPSLPYQVNVFVDNSGKKRPPVVIEPNPNFGNVFGKIERRFLFGGYLIIKKSSIIYNSIKPFGKTLYQSTLA